VGANLFIECFVYQRIIVKIMIIEQTIASEIGVQPQQVQAAVQLLDEGASVPFIARYRKEATGGLTDTDLRQLAERLTYLRELAERRQTVLTTIAEQGKLTPELQQQIQAATTKTRLEDLYLPYKPKRRTKAQIAREAGLQPLAEGLLADPSQNPQQLAQDFLNPDKQISEVKEALDGAKQILMEIFSEDAELVDKLRQLLWREADLSVQVMEGQQQAAAKYQDYFAFREPLQKVPSHRTLAVLRGRQQGLLKVSLAVGEEAESLAQIHPCEAVIASHWHIVNQERAADNWLQEVVRWSWRIKLLPRLETELIGQLRGSAEQQAIKVFAENLEDLLLAPPAGAKITLGLDPGLRTGVKGVVVDGTGKLLAYQTLFPHAPKNQWQQALAQLTQLCQQHQVSLISIGNGTASRETDQLVTELMASQPELKLSKQVVSEAGASVYSASELAAEEFPDLDVTYRGAVSIARRLQDPLAELVKIDPKAIGVGQYQHDISPVKLAHSLAAVVEDCVNKVGVDVNTASSALLTHIAGLNNRIASQVVNYRDQHGPFPDRQQLTQVPGLGAKTFQQAAGFLRINNGSNTLDRSSVHPEAYHLVERIAQQQQRPIDSLIGDKALLKRLNPADYTDEQFGLPTVSDILQELEKPGRDPRPSFKAVEFKAGVTDMSHLKPGMTLSGVITNVTHFGAFVDVGVHQDGLVHISALSDSFIKDPRDVVKVGDIVKVKVMNLDIERRRIGLTMRLTDAPDDQAESKKKNPSQTANKTSNLSKAAQKGKNQPNNKNRKSQGKASEPSGGIMAMALAEALKKS
jgi:uncharacterized protein